MGADRAGTGTGSGSAGAGGGAPGDAPGADASRVDAFAQELRSAQDSARHIVPLTSRPGGLDVATAYRVSARLHELRLAEGDVPVGRKIGFTNAAIQREYGVHEPIWGYVYRRTLVDVAAQSTFSIAHLAKPPRLEPEIVLRFRESPPVGGSTDDILACVDAIAHGFEIVQSNFPDWKFQAADTIADNGLHRALLMGPLQPVETLGAGLADALATLTVVLSCDGQLRDSGVGANALGSPLTAVAHLTRVLASQGAALSAGEVVTTGTLTSAVVIQPGETWSTGIGGIALPGLSIRFI